jgi:hypothetical protein
MPTWLAALCTLALLGSVLWWWGKRPVYYHEVSLSRLPRFVDGFLDQQDTGGVMMMELEPGPGFLQFALTQARGKTQHVEFGFPETSWSSATFPRLQQALTAAGFAPSVEDGPDGGEVRSFMRVRLGGAAEPLTRQILSIAQLSTQTLGWTDATFTIHFEGAPRPRAWRVPRASPPRPVA